MTFAVVDEGGFTEAPGDDAPIDHVSPNKCITNAFSKLDVNGDGSISREELWSYFCGNSGNGSIKKEDFDKLFDAIDKDKSGEIDFAEYSCFAGQVQRMYAGRKARKSSMKVSTLRESLLETKSKRRSSLGTIRNSLARGMSSRRHDLQHSQSRRGSLRRQKATRRATTEGVADEKEEAPSRTSVRFFDVEVREYGMTASDNPSVRAGVALEMSWDFNILQREHIDTFDGRRSKKRAKNYVKEKMLTRRERERILLEHGATAEEIQKATKRAASARKARKRSVATQDHDQLKEDFEDVMRLFRKISPFAKHKRKSTPLKETLDVERLHPTLVAMIGLDASGKCSSDEKTPQ